MATTTTNSSRPSRSRSMSSSLVNLQPAGVDDDLDEDHRLRPRLRDRPPDRRIDLVPPARGDRRGDQPRAAGRSRCHRGRHPHPQAGGPARRPARPRVGRDQPPTNQQRVRHRLERIMAGRRGHLGLVGVTSSCRCRLGRRSRRRSRRRRRCGRRRRGRGRRGRRGRGRRGGRCRRGRRLRGRPWGSASARSPSTRCSRPGPLGDDLAPGEWPLGDDQALEDDRIERLDPHPRLRPASDSACDAPGRRSCAQVGHGDLPEPRATVTPDRAHLRPIPRAEPAR